MPFFTPIMSRAAYTPLGIAFDGAADYLTRGGDLTGASDTKYGVLSFWVKFDSDGTDHAILHTDGGGFYVFRSAADNKIYITAERADGTPTLNINTSAILAADGWVHVLSSWKHDGSAESHLYVNQVSDKTATTHNSDDLDYTRGTFYIGATNAPANYLDGCIAEVWFSLASADYLDFSVTANRVKFSSLGGSPADIGADGSRPTGNQPILYLSARPGDAASDFLTNRGSGGDFTDAGSVALSSTNPKF